MLRRALAICTSSLLLLLGAPSFAQDDFEDPEDVLLGPDEQEETGPDYARDGFYLQFGYTYGFAHKLEDKLNANRDKFRLEPQASDAIKDERLTPFIDGDPPPGGQRENPLRDGDCTKLPAALRCDINTMGSVAQIGGTIRRQATPGLASDLDPRVAPVFLPGTAGVPAMELGKADVSGSHGVDFRAGSRVLPNLAIEVQLEYMTGFEVDIPNLGQAPPPPAPPPFPAGEFVDDNVTYQRANSSDKINVDLLSLTFNLKVPLLTGRVQPYALIGGGAVFVARDGNFPKREIRPGATSSDPYRFEEYVDVRNTGAVFRLGGGIDTYLTENIYLALEATWVAAQGEAMNDLRYVTTSFGVGYRF